MAHDHVPSGSPGDGGLSRYQCPDCTSTFSRRQNLQRHRRTRMYQYLITHNCTYNGFNRCWIDPARMSKLPRAVHTDVRTKLFSIVSCRSHIGPPATFYKDIFTSIIVGSSWHHLLRGHVKHALPPRCGVTGSRLARGAVQRGFDANLNRVLRVSFLGPRSRELSNVLRSTSFEQR